LLGEQLHEAPWGIAVSAVGLVMIVAGLVVLAGSEGTALEEAEALEPSAAPT
jgi:hypothetical protein